MSWSPGGPAERKKGRLRGFMLTEVAWKQSLVDHQKRMGKIKPTIQFDKNAPATGPGKPGSLKHKPAAPSGSRPGTARSAGRSGGAGSRPATAGRSPRGPQHQADHQSGGAPPGHLAMAQEDFGIHSLTPDQQNVCKKMMKLLVGLENQQQSKKIVEEIFVSAEESRLLQGYTGVLPGMERPETAAEEDEDEQEEQREEEERHRREEEEEARQQKRQKKQKEEEEKRKEQEEQEKEDKSRRSSEKSSNNSTTAAVPPPAAEKKEQAAPAQHGENYEDDQDFEH